MGDHLLLILLLLTIVLPLPIGLEADVNGDELHRSDREYW